MGKIIEKSFATMLICFLLITVNFSLVSAQTQPDNDAASVAKIKAKVAKYGTKANKRVRVKMRDGRKVKGYISQPGADSFALTDAKTNQVAVVAYRDVTRVGNSKINKIFFGVVIGAAIALAIAVGVKTYFN